MDVKFAPSETNQTIATPTIEVTSKAQIDGKLVYAGDSVCLSLLNGPGGSGVRTFWAVFSDPSFDRASESVSTSISSETKFKSGYAGWFVNRDLISRELEALTKINTVGRIVDLDPVTIFSKLANSQFLGESNPIKWIPRQEGKVTIGAFSVDKLGCWSFAWCERSVLDLRPVCLPVPSLPIDEDLSQEGLKSCGEVLAAGELASKVVTMASLARAVSQMTFSAELGKPFLLWFVKSPYQRAEAPLSSADLFINNEKAIPVDVMKNATEIIIPRQGVNTITLCLTDIFGLKRTSSVTVMAKPSHGYAIVKNATPTSEQIFMETLSRWSRLVAADYEAQKGKTIVVHHLHSEASGSVANPSSSNKGQQDLLDLFDHELVSALLTNGHTVIERESVWVQSLESEKKKPVSTPETILHYKLKACGVFHSRIGPLVLRKAVIDGMVRLHDLDTNRIVKTSRIKETRSDIIPAWDLELDHQHKTWNAYPDYFLSGEDVIQSTKNIVTTKNDGGINKTLTSPSQKTINSNSNSPATIPAKEQNTKAPRAFNIKLPSL